LGGEDCSVLASVLQTLVPREINLEIVLIGEGVVNCFDQWHCCQDLFAHFIHGVLDASAIVCSEGLQSNLAGSIPCLVKLGHHRLDFGKGGEGLPLPASLYLRAQNAVPCLRELSVCVAVEVIEGRTGALKNKKFLNLGAQGDALVFPCNGLDNTNFLAVAEEGVWVWLSINGHACPPVLDDLDVCGVDVRVGLDEVSSDNGCEELGGCDRVLLGEDVASLLLGVGGYDDRIVCRGIAGRSQVLLIEALASYDGALESYDGALGSCLRGVNIALQKGTDSHFNNGLSSSLLILVDLVKADIVLAIACGAERHDS
jgi:hypothetical protein